MFFVYGLINLLQFISYINYDFLNTHYINNDLVEGDSAFCQPKQTL